MTMEERKQAICFMTEQLRFAEGTGAHKHFMYAIEALKAEPCDEQSVYMRAYREGYDKGYADGDFFARHEGGIKESCEDAVKREAVLNTLDTMDKALDENRTVESYKELLKECYKELPPVTPKPTECENAVSLDGVINTIEWYRTNPQHFTEDNLIEDMKGLPPVTPKPLDSVLDEIRAEIEKLPSELTYDGRRMIRQVRVYDIIDKYKKGESE